MASQGFITLPMRDRPGLRRQHRHLRHRPAGIHRQSPGRRCGRPWCTSCSTSRGCCLARLDPHLAEFVACDIAELSRAAGQRAPGGGGPAQIANAHTIFNVANTLIFIWFTGQLARLVERVVPDKPLEEEAAPSSSRSTWTRSCCPRPPWPWTGCAWRSCTWARRSMRCSRDPAGHRQRDRETPDGDPALGRLGGPAAQQDPGVHGRDQQGHPYRHPDGGVSAADGGGERPGEHRRHRRERYGGGRVRGGGQGH